MQRRTPGNYDLQLPLSVIGFGPESAILQGVTKSIGSRGVLFVAETEIRIDAQILYVITWNQSGPEPVNLRCLGRVLRITRIENPWGPKFEIAASLERHEFLRDSRLPNGSEPGAPVRSDR